MYSDNVYGNIKNIDGEGFRLAGQLMLPWVFEKLDRQASASITIRVLNGRHGHGRGA